MLVSIWLTISPWRRQKLQAQTLCKQDATASSVISVCLHLSLHLHGEVLEHLVQVSDAPLQLQDLVVSGLDLIQGLPRRFSVNQDLQTVQIYMSCMLGVMWMKLLYKHLEWVLELGSGFWVLSAAKTLQTRRSVQCLPSLMSSLSNKRKRHLSTCRHNWQPCSCRWVLETFLHETTFVFLLPAVLPVYSHPGFFSCAPKSLQVQQVLRFPTQLYCRHLHLTCTHILGEHVRLPAFEHRIQLVVGHVCPSWGEKPKSGEFY